MQITVYTGPSCGRCIVMKRALAARSIAHTVIDIAQNAGAADMLRQAGQRELPVIEIDGVIVGAGYSPALIDKIAKAAA